MLCNMDLLNKDIIYNNLVSEKVDNHGLTKDILNSWKIALKKTMKFIDLGQFEDIGFAVPDHL